MAAGESGTPTRYEVPDYVTPIDSAAPKIPGLVPPVVLPATVQWTSPCEFHFEAGRNFVIGRWLLYNVFSGRYPSAVGPY